MAGHMPMRQISRQELYTDIESRVRYLHSFLDFGSEDIEALIYASKYVKILIPAVVNIVYKKLLQYDITARAFTTRSTSFEGPIDEIPTENSPQMLHRKAFLRAYLSKLCSDPSQLDYWKYCNKVGMMHVGLGREHPLHIEYIHLGATMALIQEVMTEAILSHPRLSLPRKISIVKALGKVIWIQNDLMAKWHVRDGEEFQEGTGPHGEGQDHPTIEPEGYLDGKKILEDFDSGEDSSSSNGGGSAHGRTPSSGIPRPSSNTGASGGGGGVCPFSGMSRDMQNLKIGGENGGKGAPQQQQQQQHHQKHTTPAHEGPAPSTPPSRKAPSVLPRLASFSTPGTATSTSTSASASPASPASTVTASTTTAAAAAAATEDGTKGGTTQTAQSA